MGEFSREYLELLAEKYPNEAAVCSEIINLSAILTLPKGTEHFISDLHGEYGAVRHILNNCSGVILEKVRRLFEDTQGEAKCRALCSVIYYPIEELACLRERGELDNARLREILEQLCLLAETLSGKYTRGYVRHQMPAGWEFVLDELLHIQRDEDANQHRYHDAILDSVIATGSADSVIAALSELIKRLAVDRLHVVGDIFDRGPEPARIVDMLMQHPNLDIQWGNHDILWLGAAAGSAACVFTVLRISADYGNTMTLERRYGVSLRPLYEFCERVYGDSEKKTVHQALSVLGFKLEGHVIMRHPGYEMNDRLMLNRINYDDWTVELDSGTYPLNTDALPDRGPEGALPAHARGGGADRRVRLRLQGEPERCAATWTSYTSGQHLPRCNGNLLYHGCIPLTPDGKFASVRHGGKWYSGQGAHGLRRRRRKERLGPRRRERAGHDVVSLVRATTAPSRAGCSTPSSARWSTTRAPGPSRRNPYFNHWEDEDAARMILAEFGLDPEHRPHHKRPHARKGQEGREPRQGRRQAVHHRRRLLQGVSGHDRHRWLHADIQLARHPAQEPPSLRGRRQGAQRERGHGVRFRARRVFPDAAVHIRHRRGRAPAPEDRGAERAAGGLPGRSAAAEQIKRERERGA